MSWKKYFKTVGNEGGQLSPISGQTQRGQVTDQEAQADNLVLRITKVIFQKYTQVIPTE